jgi:hypothetical protein
VKRIAGAGRGRYRAAGVDGGTGVGVGTRVVGAGAAGEDAPECASRAIRHWLYVRLLGSALLGVG